MHTIIEKKISTLKLSDLCQRNKDHFGKANQWSDLVQNTIYTVHCSCMIETGPVFFKFNVGECRGSI